MTSFFVPDTEPEQAEARYAELAATVDVEVVPPAERVRSVLFGHGAEEWTATVGERLAGQLAAKTDRRTVRRTPIARSAPTRQVSDVTTVQAIFDAGGSYLVVTDAHPVGEIRDSTWDNPFSIARRDVRRVARFDA